MTFELASIFSDNLVFQQGQPITIWGTGEPGATVDVAFGASKASAAVDGAGSWRVTLPAEAANAKPQSLTATCTLAGEPPVVVTLTNILVGEVWVCSGQSNMEWTGGMTMNADEESAAANYPQIRLLNVTKTAAETEQSSFDGGPWTACTPKTMPNFSAVGYFFGRELHNSLKVPIGLINSSWGGTVAEAWVSREGLVGASDDIRSLVTKYETDLPQLAEIRDAWAREVARLEDSHGDKHNSGFEAGWASPSTSDADWETMDLPSTWQDRGLNFSGILWFRKTVTVPADWAGKDLTLAIGATDKSDVTYFNGVKVGSLTMAERPDAWCQPRVYTVPGELVKAGDNLIAVRVHSDKYGGGMIGPGSAMELTLPGGETQIVLRGTWRYAIEANYGLVTMPPEPLGPGSANVPATLYRGMIHPLLPFAIRGAIWYQGESNADRPLQYRELLPTLINDWRRVWNNPDLAFYIVQLANWMAVRDEPVQSNWAELREAQAMTATMPGTGLAVTIDIGDEVDIHPRNKQDVGRRLAYSALNGTYGVADVVPSGPRFREATVNDATIRVAFDFAHGLTVQGETLRGFAIAGDDGVYHWADAEIAGDTVIVSSPAVPSPTTVRYAWADNPICNLYNAAGLPAVPFRTDTL
ncbi:MAG TPA: sialate O-acetylesterase [Capsulimonadaceae bacterium]|jgi:sialate O-acetylesterase